MYWEEASDVQQPLVHDAMPRNRFRQILSYIHFSDNANLNQNDKCAKVCSLLDMCKERFRKFAMKTKSINVDESMILWQIWPKIETMYAVKANSIRL